MTINKRGRLLAAATLAGWLAVLATPVLAHAELTAAEPAADAVSTTAPTELRLTFSEPVELAFTTLKVTDAAGAEVAIQPLALDPANPQVLVAPLGAAAAAGSYKVEWTAVAADGHKSSGEYAFEVRP